MTYCKWDKISELYKRYHDEEWGIPLHNDQMQFEFLMMEAMQCGLSWKLMLQKRETFRRCFDNFNYEKFARYNEPDIVSRIVIFHYLFLICSFYLFHNAHYRI